MRKTSLVFLCIALWLTVILPISAKKGGGGGQSPTTVQLDGDVIYDGPAKLMTRKEVLV